MTRAFPSLLVVSSCTGVKLHKPGDQLTLQDFQQGPEHVKTREKTLAPFMTSALRMYTGMQHLQVQQGFEALRANRHLVTRLEIISAGYGLIPAAQFIAPYETTFNDLNSKQTVAWSRTLGIHSALNKAIEGYDLIIFLLGEGYLKAAELPLNTTPEQSLLFLSSGTSAKSLPEHAGKQAVMPLVNKDAKRFGFGLVGLKGFLFHQLARMIAGDPEVLREWHANPQAAVDALEAWQKHKGGAKLLSLPEPDDEAPAEPQDTALVPGIHSSGFGFNPRHLSSEEFYPPPQHDLPVPPRARFTVVINNRDKLKLTLGRPAPHMERIWHFIERPPRGYLTSLAYHHPDNDPLPVSEEGNIYDCGAWSYKSEPYPVLKKKDGPLTPDSTMRLFQAAGARPGVDIIVSPDMMILDNDAPERAQEKIDVSLSFAQEMRPLAPGHRLMAVTHGSFEQRHRMMERYLEMGYTHVALGSLAMKSSRDPYFVYRCVEDALRYREQVPGLYIHVLGVSSIKWAATLTHLGVDSFDGSSMYMQAFTAGQFMQYVPDSEKLLYKHRIVENRPWSDELPPCLCPACVAMREEGWDTRAQGGSTKDASGRPYNGGNEANMGRAVHNINMYLRALQDVQARVMAGDESLLVKRTRYEARRGQREAEMSLLLN